MYRPATLKQLFYIRNAQASFFLLANLLREQKILPLRPQSIQVNLQRLACFHGYRCSIFLESTVNLDLVSLFGSRQRF